MNFEPYEGDQPYIFISYSHNDIPVVYEILENLNTAGFRIWYDAGIPLTVDYSDNIATHIKNCAAVIVFHSPNSVKSDYCRNEIYYACNNKKPILPIYLEQTELPDGVKLRLELFQAINFKAYPNRNDFYKKIFNAEVLKICKRNDDMGTAMFHGENLARAYYKETDPLKKAELREKAIYVLKRVVDSGFVFGEFSKPTLESLRKSARYEVNAETVDVLYKTALTYLDEYPRETNYIKKFSLKDNAIWILEKIAASELVYSNSAKEKLAQIKAEDEISAAEFKARLSLPSKYQKKS